jgi:DNA sulfur modification protein DndE
MPSLQLKRVKFSRESDNWLRTLKSRTGITPNLLCRLGFCLSLEEISLPDPAKYPEDSGREINRYTLVGEFDTLYEALLRQRLADAGVLVDSATSEMLDDQFRAHMNRGVILLAARMKTLTDLDELSGGARTSVAAY